MWQFQPPGPIDIDRPVQGYKVIYVIGRLVKWSHKPTDREHKAVLLVIHHACAES